jgi:uncharacterized protein YehS (DUF1456 family)
MTVEMYDAMAIEDQSDYLKSLVKRAHDVFVAEGQKDLAAKLDELFRTRRGEPQSTGEAQLEKQLAITRNIIAWEQAQGLRLKVLPGDVEHALLVVLQKNGIPMSHERFKALSQAWTAKPFWPKRPLQQSSVVSSQ